MKVGDIISAKYQQLYIFDKSPNWTLASTISYAKGSKFLILGVKNKPITNMFENPQRYNQVFILKPMEKDNKKLNLDKLPVWCLDGASNTSIDSQMNRHFDIIDEDN